nr:cytochrome c [Sneathiella limimaris]
MSAYGSASDLERGRYLTGLAGCESCHTALGSDAVPFAGGHELATPFGTFYTPNITPDTITGIGAWTEHQFIKAVKHGVRPDGKYYFPAFPYTSYTAMTDEDAALIFGYLKSLKPVRSVVPMHDLSAPFSWRWLQIGWRLLYFNEGQGTRTYPMDNEQVQRGDYLVNALGHCGECHTPRNEIGGLDMERPMAGNPKDSAVGRVPNLTPDVETGLGDWSESDLESFFQSGMKPNFDDVQGAMADVISHGTSKMTDEDLSAMISYLKNLKAVSNNVNLR